MKPSHNTKPGRSVSAGYFAASIFILITGVLGIYCIGSPEAAGRILPMVIIVMALGTVFTVTLGFRSYHSVNQTAENYSFLADEIALTAADHDEKIMVMEKIASGDLDIQLRLSSDHDRLGISIHSLLDTLKQLTSESSAFADAIINRDLKERKAPMNFSGVYRTMLMDFNKITEEAAAMITESAEHTEHMDAVNDFIKDIQELCVEMEKGNLSIRANAADHKRVFGDILTGMNRMLDAISQPLQLAAGHIEKIGRGEIPEKIIGDYQGDFNRIIVGINHCIDELKGLSECRLALERMRCNDFSAKVEGSYQGVFDDIAESVNMISDRILHIIDILNMIAEGNLDELPRLKHSGKKCENDTLLPAIVAMMEGIKALADETDTLSSAAVEGALSKRGDTRKFRGEYAKIIEGINKTLDAVTESAFEVIEVLKEVSNGNLHASVQGMYRGDHAAIKNAINETVENLRDYVNEISVVLSEISSGNLDIEITMEHKGDFMEIGDSLKNIIRTFNQVMIEFNSAAEQVSAGSRQVSEGSQFLAQGSTEQAGSIQELTASIGEIAEQSKDNASKANEVYELAKGARDGGAKGNLTMQEMLQSMKDINESSVNISKIIKVIDDIAFQTNILALNAAVEAARAGGHGKGFAVVAEEVRNLAARSAKAAEETTELIEGSIQKVQAGTKITNEIAGVLKEIAEGAVSSTEKLSIIAKASNEQAEGIAQINQGIEQISRVIQSNSATAEQSAASSQELSSQAELLKELVSRFKVGGKSLSSTLLPGRALYEENNIPMTSNEFEKY